MLAPFNLYKKLMKCEDCTCHVLQFVEQYGRNRKVHNDRTPGRFTKY